MLFFRCFLAVWPALHTTIRVGVQDDGSQLTVYENSSRRSKNISAAAAGALMAGMAVDEFKLVKRVKSWSLGVKGDNLAQQYVSKSILSSLLQKVENPTIQDFGPKQNWKKLSAGAFGEAWLATPIDPSKWQNAAQVVLKFFFTSSEDHANIQYHAYATAPENVRENMRNEAEACAVVQDLVERARSQRLSAQHYICQCLASRITDEHENSKGYIVQEYGGETLDHLAEQTNRTSENKVDDARKVTSQLLSVVQFLGEAYSPTILLHHDLKPQNIAYRRIQGQISIKVIDWGGSLVAEPGKYTNAHECQWTKEFSPPEAMESNQLCFAINNPQSFDIYATALIYIYMLTGTMPWLLTDNNINSQLCQSMKTLAPVFGFSFLREDWLFLSFLGRVASQRPSPVQAVQHCMWKGTCPDAKEIPTCT